MHNLYALTITRIAIHYNPAQLHGTYALPQEIIRVKTDPMKAIIVYDEDETLAHKVAQSFAERDISNVWMLSGGIFAVLSEAYCYRIECALRQDSRGDDSNWCRV